MLDSGETRSQVRGGAASTRRSASPTAVGLLSIQTRADDVDATASGGRPPAVSGHGDGRFEQGLGRDHRERGGGDRRGYLTHTAHPQDTEPGPVRLRVESGVRQNARHFDGLAAQSPFGEVVRRFQASANEALGDTWGPDEP